MTRWLMHSQGTVSIIEGTGEVMAMPALSKRDLPSQVIAYLLALEPL